MYIKNITIKNFRGLDIEIDKVKKVSMIIGQNDSGKTNICHAILKVLDYKKRKIPFSITDSTNSNKEDIIIKITLDASSLNSEQLGTIGKFIHKNNESKEISVKLVSKFNEETEEYEDTLIYGDPSKDFEEQKNGTQTLLDKVLSIVYISPVYDITDSENNYFSFVENTNKKSNIKFDQNVLDSIEVLNASIQNDPIVTTMQDDINSNGFENLFDDYKFKIVSKTKLNNLYKSLDIVPNKNDNDIEHIGDAKNKLLSTILKSKIYDSNKQKIYLIEEPENHLYVLLQKMYIKALLNMNPEQIIFTTHSPFTIDFEKINQIIKIVQCNDIYIFNNNNEEDFKKYGYLINIQIAEMLYYDEVLLVEGSSEKYFYSYLMSSSNEFLEKINDKKLGICEIDGIAFKTTKELLTYLGIKVYIKTDNDIFLTSNSKNNQYAGILRCINFLTEKEQNEFYEKVNLKKDDFIFNKELATNEIVENKMDDICAFFYNKNIFLSKHKDGFEGDFIEFLELNGSEINDDTINYLKKAKLKNLHRFITEGNYKIDLNEKTKKSILVSFLYE